MGLKIGAVGRVERVVTDADTAIELGSGDVPVLATPRLLAWAEAATLTALDGGIDAATTSVGSRVELEHRAPSPVGEKVALTAELVAVDGRLLHFAVRASNPAGDTVASGEIVRVLVDRSGFLERLTRQ